MESLRRALARFKHARELVIMDELPRNTMGKVQKNILRDQFREMFTSGDLGQT
jgi:malonyl-CoA/methylmalonyl-CoA synthetase